LGGPLFFFKTIEHYQTLQKSFVLSPGYQFSHAAPDFHVHRPQRVLFGTVRPLVPRRCETVYSFEAALSLIEPHRNSRFKPITDSFEANPYVDYGRFPSRP